MKKLLVLTCLIVLSSGCAKVISERDRFITLSHAAGESHFSKAYEKAQEYCSSKGLIAKKTATDCPFKCISEFECVDR